MSSTSVALAVAALTGVGFFSDRLQGISGTTRRANMATITQAMTTQAVTTQTTGAPGLTRFLLVASWALAMPLAVTAYPALQWRHPVDAVALTTVVGAGILATLQPQSQPVLDATGVVLGSVLVAHTWWRLERAHSSTR